MDSSTHYVGTFHDHKWLRPSKTASENPEKRWAMDCACGTRVFAAKRKDLSRYRKP